MAPTGNFIFQNYWQALDRILVDTPKLEALAAALKLKSEDYEQHLQAERDHLQSLKEEPENERIAIDYVELLSKARELK